MSAVVEEVHVVSVSITNMKILDAISRVRVEKCLVSLIVCVRGLIPVAFLGMVIVDKTTEIAYYK